VQAVADDITHDEGDAGAGQRDDVEPVATHIGLGGQVAVGDLDRGLFGKLSWQEAALQGERGSAFAGVATGVVEAQRGTGGELRGQRRVVVLVGLRLCSAVEARHAQGDATGTQGDGGQ